MAAPRHIVGVDTEYSVDDHTLVCLTLSWYVVEGGAIVHHGDDLYHARDERALSALLSVLSDPEVLTVWMSGSNDVVVMTLFWGRVIFDAFWSAAHAGRVTDVYHREFLWWCAAPDLVDWFQVGSDFKYVPPTAEGKASATSNQPSFALDSILYRWLGEVLPKDDSIRLTYGDLRETPIDLWGEAHKTYAVDDSRANPRAWFAQLTGRAIVGSRILQTPSGKVGGWAWSQQNFDNTARSLPRTAQVLRGETDMRSPSGWLLPGEQKRIIDSIALTWLCEPRNGSLYCDTPYAMMMRDRYSMPVKLLHPVMRRAGILREDNTKCADVARQWAELLFEQMGPDWRPPLTQSGIRMQHASSRNIAYSNVGWRSLTRQWRDVCSVGNKPIQECVVALGGTGERSAPILRAVSEGKSTPEVIKAFVRGSWTGETPDIPTLPERIKPKKKPPPKRKRKHEGQQDLFAQPVEVAPPPPVPTLNDVRIVTRATLVYTKAHHILTQSIEPALAAGNAAIVPRRTKPLITGRWSLEGAVLRQNKERSGGSREVCVPAEGHKVFVADYSTIELFGFAKVIASAWEWKHKLPEGSYISSLARVLLAGKDPHIILALRLLARSNPKYLEALERIAQRGYYGQTFSGEYALHDVYNCIRDAWKAWAKSVEQTIKAGTTPPEPTLEVKILGKLLDDKRDEAKRCNFGLAGLMGPEKFIQTQRLVGDYSWTLPKATTAWQDWREQWFESGAFQELVYSIARGGDAIRHAITNRLRGKLTPTQLANTLFQTPIAEMFYEAHTEVWYEAHWVEDSPLYETNQVAPIHDEIVSTGPNHRLSSDLCPEATRSKCKHTAFSGCRTALARKQEIMQTVGLKWLPGLPVSTSGAILDRFAKA